MRAMSAWVLPRGTRVELNRDAYVQPDPVERANMYATLHGIVDEKTGQHAITVDEIRIAERIDDLADRVNPGVLR